MPSSHSKQTSVFHALGSYADRIKEQQQSNNTDTLSSSTAPTTTASSSAASPTSTPSMSKAPSASAREPHLAPASSAKDDEGPWETVRTGRKQARNEKPEEKRGSNSRNWRERDEKPEASSKKEAASAEENSNEQRRSNKKETTSTSSSKTPAASAAAGSSSRQPAAAAATPAKSVWGSLSQQSTPPATEANGSASPSASASTPATDGPAAAQVPKVPEGPAKTEPSKPSSPTDEATKPKAGSADAEGSWRARPKAAPEPAPAPVVRKAAPPPAVNAWDLRKKQAPKPTAASTPAQDPAAPAAQSGPTPGASVAASSEVPATPKSSDPTTEVKTSGKKKKKHSGEHHNHGPQHHADTHLWPDVSQAAAAKSAEEGKRSKHEKKESESSLAEDNAAQGGKKQKWMPIPAAELQEAADKAAETTRRQASKSKSRANKDAESGEGKRGKKGGEAKKSQAQQAPRMQRSGSQGSEARLPPFPEAQRGHPNGYRFGTTGAADRAEIVNGDGFNGYVNGTLSAPLSRQASQQSKRASPIHSTVPLTPEGATRELDGARPGVNGTNLPRGPRGRDREGRGGYGGGRGGRGAYRSASNASARYGADLSPLAGNSELANLYQRGYGMGYSYYPVPSGGFVLAPPGYDAAQYAASMQVYPRSMPPPPQPVTQVSNIDALRYYVLGQVEYYFSMQNLAMDFFLRQQMDSQGWIEISMIASFNRIKSLTPDVAIVREVMEMSALLEVKEDMVRLAGDEALRWVLPDAPPCKFSGGSPGRNLSPKKLAGEGAELSHGVPGGVDTLGIEDLLHAATIPKFDVENALMRNARDGSANLSTSSAASVLASDEGKTMTPETSIAGDSKSEFDAEDIKMEQQ